MLRYIFSFCVYLSLAWTFSLQKHEILKLPVKNNDGRVFGGNQAQEGQFPWEAFIISVSDFVIWPCAGSIISDQWILTSGQCLEGADAALVGVGSTDFALDTDPEKMLYSYEVYVHENYISIIYANDIGLIKLENPLTFDETTSAIALSFEPVDAGTDITVTGWGAPNDQGVWYDYLHYIVVTTIGNTECVSIYGDVISNEKLCSAAGSPVKGVCISDPGNAAVVNADTNPELVAVVSFLSARGCGNGDPSVYTRVAGYKEWIQNKTEISF